MQIADHAKQFYGEKARQTVVASPDVTRALGPRLADLKADVRALEDSAARAVVDRLGHPALWSRCDEGDPHWWWRDDFDCDYETGDADRALRDRLYSVFGRLQPLLQEYGYQPDWRGVNIANRRALFAQASFQKAFGEYRALLASSRNLRRTVDYIRRQRARQEAGAPVARRLNAVSGPSGSGARRAGPDAAAGAARGRPRRAAG